SLVHEAIHRISVSEPKLEEPTCALRICVDHCGIVDNSLVDLDTFVSERGKHIGARFHGFDARRTIAFRERGAHLGQLDEYDVAEQVRRVSGDAYRRNVPFEP